MVVKLGSMRTTLTARKAAIIGGASGAALSTVVLALLWSGVSGVLFIGNIDFASVLWPSFFMITTSWHTTLPGVVITGMSIAINCLVYAAVALVLRLVVRFGLNRR